MSSKRKREKHLEKISSLGEGDSSIFSNSEEAEIQITESCGNIFLDLGFEPEEAENLRIRADLMTVVREIISKKEMTQRQAAEYFGVHAPRINHLMKGHIEKFTIDALVNMLVKAGKRVQYEVVDVEN